jgi:hypothetical protein
LNLSAKKSLRSESYEIFAAISIVDNADSSVRIKGLYDALHMTTSAIGRSLPAYPGRIYSCFSREAVYGEGTEWPRFW